MTKLWLSWVQYWDGDWQGHLYKTKMTGLMEGDQNRETVELI